MTEMLRFMVAVQEKLFLDRFIWQMQEPTILVPGRPREPTRMSARLRPDFSSFDIARTRPRTTTRWTFGTATPYTCRTPDVLLTLVVLHNVPLTFVTAVRHRTAFYLVLPYMLEREVTY